MLDDLPLFANTYPHFPGAQRRDTSEDAAAKIKPKVTYLRAQVLKAISDAGPAGMTDHELETELKFGPNTTRPRRCELMQMGLVMDSGRRRPTASGRMAAVWIVTP